MAAVNHGILYTPEEDPAFTFNPIEVALYRQQAAEYYPHRRTAEWILGYQAKMQINTSERERAHTLKEAVERLDARLAPCTWTIAYGAEYSKERKRKQLEANNAKAYDACLATYDGNAQPTFDMLAAHGYRAEHTDDSENEEATTSYWKQPVTSSLGQRRILSPDLYTYYEDVSDDDDDVFITRVEAAASRPSLLAMYRYDKPITPGQRRKQSEASTVELSPGTLTAYEKQVEGSTILTAIEVKEEEEEDEGICDRSIADMDEEGEELIMTCIKNDERMKARKLVRASYLSIKATVRMFPLGRSHDDAAAFRRLGSLFITLAERKRRYEEARRECEAYEEELEYKRRREGGVKEELERCLAVRRAGYGDDLPSLIDMFDDDPMPMPDTLDESER